MNRTHFIGLGGIGMSALARVLLQKGCPVQGSDAVRTPLLEQLEKEGATVYIGHHADQIQPGMTVVYSTDIKETNVELTKAKNLTLPLFHRSDFLDQLMKGKKGLLVTGTHGKTTTTALLSSVLSEAGFDPSFVVGGILRSLNTNGKGGNGPYFVAEADESDGSFLKTPSFGAIVTNLENEHMNYWQTSQKLDAGFRQFFSQVQEKKHLFWCGDDSRLSALSPPGISYGFSTGAKALLSQFHTTEEGICFDLDFEGKPYRSIELSLFGRHNALNGAAVFALALSLGVPESALRSAFRKFSGTKRRLEWKGEVNQITIYDDYGHHPTEITVTLRALRERRQGNRLVAVFQPHRYSRVKELFEEFLRCFDAADEVILTNIYSAGETPIAGITTEGLHLQMKEKLGTKLHFMERESLEKHLSQFLKSGDIVLTLGAGDVTRIGDPLLRLLQERG